MITLTTKTLIRRAVRDYLRADAAVLALLGGDPLRVVSFRSADLSKEEAIGGLINVLTPDTRRSKGRDQNQVIEFDRSISIVIECYATAILGEDTTLADLDEEVASKVDDLEEAVITALFQNSDFVSQFQEIEGADSFTATDSDTESVFALARVSIDVSQHIVYDPVDPTGDPLTSVFISTHPIDEETGDPSADPVVEAEVALEPYEE